MSSLKSFNSSSLLRKVEKQLKDSAKDFFEQGEGGEILKNHMVEAIDEKVYNNYTPAIYQRRGDNGGLRDKRKMHVYVTGNSLGAECMHAQLSNFARHNGYKIILPDGTEKIRITPLRERIFDFLYMIKDEGLVDPKWDTTRYDVPGTSGHPLHINKAIDAKVKTDNKLRRELKRACIAGVRKVKADL